MAKHGWGKYALKHPEQAEFYAPAGWRPRRARHLFSNPFCVVCGEKATAADHIINLASGGTFDGPLQPLCAEHHRQKTQAEIEAGQQAGCSPEEEGTMKWIGYHIVQQGNRRGSQAHPQRARVISSQEEVKSELEATDPLARAANLRATPKPQIDRPLPKTIPVPQPPYTPTPPPTKE
jgi:hypothetical protein